MSKIPIFDPYTTFTSANESSNATLDISYHAEEPSTLVDGDAYSTNMEISDDDQQFMQQLDYLESLFPTPEEIEDYQEKFQQCGGVCRDDIIALESKYPGLFTNLGFSLENYTYLPSSRCLTATVESMEMIKSISLIVVLIGGLVKLLSWLGLFEKFGDGYSEEAKKVLDGKMSVDEYLKKTISIDDLSKTLGPDAPDETIAAVADFMGIDKDELTKAVRVGKLSDILANTKKSPYRALAATPIMTDGDRLVKYLTGIRDSLKGEKDGLISFINGLSQHAKDASKNKHSVDTPDSTFDAKKLPDPPNEFMTKVASSCGLQLHTVTIKEYTVKMLTDAEFDGLKKEIHMPKRPENTYEAAKLTIIDDIDKLATAAITYLIAVDGFAKSIKIDHLKKELKSVLATYKEKAAEARSKIGHKLTQSKDKADKDNGGDGDNKTSESTDKPAAESRFIYALEAINTSGADGKGQPPTTVGDPTGSLDVNTSPDLVKNTYTKLYEALKDIESQLTTILPELGNLCHRITKFYDNIGTIVSKKSKKAKTIEKPKE